MNKTMLSRFAHVFEKNGVVALYHTLRMRPLFLEQKLWDYVQESILGKSTDELESETCSNTNLKTLLNSLRESKVITDDRNDDDKVIEFFRSMIGKPNIGIVYFILTDKCNFSCRYCFVKNSYPEDYVEKSMEIDIAEKGLDRFCEFIKNQPETFDEEKVIIFYGGEPLINIRTLIFLLEKVKVKINLGHLPQKTTLSLITNGTLITKEIAKLLKEHKVSVGISIDGDELTTNQNRLTAGGGPVYREILNGYRLLQEAEVDVGVSCTLSPESVDDFQNTLHVLLDDLKVKGLGFNLALATDSFQLPPNYAERASDCIIEAFKIFREKGVYDDRIMRKVNSFTKAEIHPFDCGASGAGQIVIAPDGEIGICHGYLGERKHFVAHVNDDSFKPETNPVFLEWSKRSPFAIDACQDCSALGICGGGCPLQAEIETGTIWGLDKRFCVHAKKTLEWLVWDLYDKLPA